MKTAFLLFFILMLWSTYARSQQTYNNLTVKDLASNKITVTSTTQSSKPCPSMTEAQRDALSASLGHCVYNSDDLMLNIYDGSDWQAAGGGIDNWITATSYDVGAVVIESNKIYQCNNAHTSGTFAADISSWTQLSNNVSDVSGTLPLANGGTSKSLTASGGAIAYSDADSLELLAPGTSGYLLKSNGSSAPSWLNTVPASNGGTGATSLTLNNVVLGNGASSVQFVAPGSSGNMLVSDGTTWTSSSISGSSLVTSPSLTNPSLISFESSSVGVVSQDDSDAVNGNCAVTDTSLYTCTWNTSYWAAAPKCEPNVTSGSQNFKADKETIPTTTSAIFRTSNSTTGAKAAAGFTVFCHGEKQ